MATTPEQHFAQSFESDFDLLYQQTESKLFSCVRTGTQTVEQDYKNFIGVLDDDDDEDATRHAPTVWTEMPHTRRRVTLLPKTKAVPLDEADRLMMQYDPKSGYVTGLTGYYGRFVDRKILKAMGGTAYTGKDGTTTVNNYDSGESRVMNSDGTLATAGSAHSDTTATALTAKKLCTLRALMTDAGVPDDGRRYVAVDELQVENLMVDTTWSAQEAMTIRNIKEGKMERLLGFNFVVLPVGQFTMSTTDTEAYKTYAWHRDAVYFASGNGASRPQVRIEQRPDMNYTWQVWCKAYTACTRLLGPGVVQVLLKKLTYVS